MPLEDLPAEVLQCVVDNLDPACDTPTLLSLMRVSSSMWEAAARRLYATMALDRDQVVLLIAGRWRRRPDDAPASDAADRAPVVLSQRTRLALSFVRRLTLLGYWTTSIVEMLWDAAAQGARPLFPNVEQLLLDIGPPFDWRAVPWLRCARPTHPEFFVFDSLDVCILGDENQDLLFRLPARHYRSITCHEVALCSWLARAWDPGDSLQWDEWRCFLSDAWEGVETTACDLQRLTWDDFEEDHIPPFRLPPLQVCLNYGDTLGKDIVDHFEERYSNHDLRVFKDTSHIVQFSHFPPDGEGASPCKLCGTYAVVRLGRATNASKARRGDPRNSWTNANGGKSATRSPSSSLKGTFPEMSLMTRTRRPKASHRTGRQMTQSRDLFRRQPRSL